MKSQHLITRVRYQFIILLLKVRARHPLNLNRSFRLHGYDNLSKMLVDFICTFGGLYVRDLVSKLVNLG